MFGGALGEISMLWKAWGFRRCTPELKPKPKPQNLRPDNPIATLGNPSKILQDPFKMPVIFFGNPLQVYGNPLKSWKSTANPSNAVHHSHCVVVVWGEGGKTT